MKKIFVVLSAALLLFSCSKNNIQPYQKKDFSKDWKFSRDNEAAVNVSLPHTSRVEKLVVIKQWQGDCVYSKTFDLLPDTDKKQFLYFEGVMHEAEVLVNGQKATYHAGGYTPFTVDITALVKKGSNTVEVRVNNEDNKQIPPGKTIETLDFNYYGGIYRNVYLITTDKLYVTDAVAANVVAGGGVSIHFDQVSKEKASGEIKVHVKNEFDKTHNVTVEVALTDTSGTRHTFTSAPAAIGTNSDAAIVLPVTINTPKLWGVSDPQLYTVDITLKYDGKATVSQPFKTGIRKVELREDGFYLNSERLFINGTNRHQEYPYLGYAISDEAQYRDAYKIKLAGFDFVRLSHYPQSEAFLNACDELGILVMDCISGWQFFGDKVFQERSFQEIRDLARRDRNHPSIAFWEVSLNESEMDEAYIKKANDILREELPFGNIYTAGWMDNKNYDLFIPARQHGKAPEWWSTYNQGNRKILIAEYGDWEYYAQNAGFNQTQFANLNEEERTSRQLRGSGEKRLLQQAFNFQEAFNSNLIGKNTIGHANWLMFDYNRGYSPDIESSGISDIFRIPKFAFYFYQSQRSPEKLKFGQLEVGPMVNIATYWDEKSSPQVTIYSNCEEVALYHNDKLVARRKPNRDAYSDHLQYPPFVFNVPAKGGTLRAEGFIKGKKQAEHSVARPLEAAAIQVSIDLSDKSINPDKPDMIFVYAEIVDKDGTVLNDYTGPVTFSLQSGNAELVGQNPINAEAGIAAIVLRTENLDELVEITASAKGLPSQTIRLK